MREKRTFNGGESALLPGRRAHEYGTPGRRSDNLMHFTDSKIALRDAVVRPSKRLFSWAFIDGAEKDRALAGRRVDGVSRAARAQ